MLNRLTGHYALTAHWVLLLALGLCLFGRSERRFLWWIPLLALLVVTQFYFAVMAFALWTADVTRAWLSREVRDSPRVCSPTSSWTLAAVLVTLWSAGFLSRRSRRDRSRHGGFSTG